ncbi:beta and beta-prime subunits of DNA dependent RNA-polymerase, partial [Pisolithus thermaeus]
MVRAIQTGVGWVSLIPSKLESLVKQHIDSVNYFVDVIFKNIVKANSKVTSYVDPRFWLKYTDIHVGFPDRADLDAIGETITPHECCLRDKTYSAPILNVVRRPSVNMGRPPIMLRSSKCVLTGRSEAQLPHMDECPLDPGGYFVVNGTGKIILNRIIVETDPVKGVIQASFTYDLSPAPHGGLQPRTYIATKKGKICLRHKSMYDDAPIVVALTALGIQSDKEVLLLTASNMEAYKSTFSANLEEAAKLTVFTRHQVKPWKETMEAPATIVLARVPVTTMDFRSMAIFVATMTRRVLMAMHDEKTVDDCDYVGNKRLEFTRRQSLKKPSFTHEFDAFNMIQFQGDQITTSFVRAIATGTGCFISALGMMTRISSQFEKTRKVGGPRALQPSQWGMLCPSDTPEGEACGLFKNLALMTHITNDILALLLMYGPHTFVAKVNGTIIGLTRHPARFVTNFRRLRRSGRFSEFVSVYVYCHHRAVRTASDGGRICRPLMIVENGYPRVTSEHIQQLKAGALMFGNFLRKGLVEYLDVNEENDSYIASYESNIVPATTHSEIEPFTVLVAVADLIPHQHHNQSPRNTYQRAVGKQAIGTIAYNQFNRINTLLYLSVYPQQPMVKTKTIELTGHDRLPAGALVLNKASLDRGYGRCQVLRKNSTFIRKYPTGTFDRLADAPLDENGSIQKKYDIIPMDSLAGVGEPVDLGNIYLNKQTPTNANDNTFTGQAAIVPYKNTPLTYKSPVAGYIDKVLVSDTENDPTLIKGVCGLIANEEDLPFKDQGLNMITNPLGKMIELLAGKAGVLSGKLQYGTAFGGSKVENIMAFNYARKDMLTSGITGEPMEHMVMDKMHARAMKQTRGPRATLTRQPIEGRSRDGGLRLGEMERDWLIGYGATQFLLERLMISLVEFEVNACQECGLMGYNGWCPYCKSPSSKKMAKLSIAYAAELLLHE